MRLALLALTLSAALVYGCGGDDEADSSAPPAPAATQEDSGSGGAEAQGEVVAVGMQDIAFKPDSSTVKLGQTVTWTNREEVQHNVVSEEGEKFKSELFGQGGTFSYEPKKAGTINYVCTIHPGMDGTLTVSE